MWHLILTAAVQIRDMRLRFRSLKKLLYKKRQYDEVRATSSNGGTFISALRIWRKVSRRLAKSPREDTRPETDLRWGAAIGRAERKDKGSGEGHWQGDNWGTGSCFW